MAEKTDFLAGLVIGTLVGIGLGMLFAPEAGQKTRERLRGKADEMGGRLRESADDVADRLRDTADDVVRRSRDTLGESSQRLRTAYERGRDAVQQKRDEIIERIEDTD